MNLKYKEGKWVFDTTKELNESQKNELFNYAVEYLYYYNIVNRKKISSVSTDFWLNHSAIKVIKVEAVQKILGFKRVKTFYFDLLKNKVELVIPGVECCYSVKKRISDGESINPTSFLEFISRQRSHLEELNISYEEKEYDIPPVSIS